VFCNLKDVGSTKFCASDSKQNRAPGSLVCNQTILSLPFTKFVDETDTEDEYELLVLQKREYWRPTRLLTNCAVLFRSANCKS